MIMNSLTIVLSPFGKIYTIRPLLLGSSLSVAVTTRSKGVPIVENCEKDNFKVKTKNVTNQQVYENAVNSVNSINKLSIKPAE